MHSSQSTSLFSESPDQLITGVRTTMECRLTQCQMQISVVYISLIAVNCRLAVNPIFHNTTIPTSGCSVVQTPGGKLVAISTFPSRAIYTYLRISVSHPHIMLDTILVVSGLCLHSTSAKWYLQKILGSQIFCIVPSIFLLRGSQRNGAIPWLIFVAITLSGEKLSLNLHFAAEVACRLGYCINAVGNYLPGKPID